MRRLDQLWERIVSFDNLYAAYGEARRGKRERPDVIAFGLDLERELLDLRDRLREGRYQPGRYRIFTVYERKPRQIAAAPFVDRVVHHALMRIIEPELDRGFSDASFACRRGKGVHAAVDQYQRYARRFAYVVRLDVRQYFASIDHRLLKAALAWRIRDARTLRLLDDIIDASPAVARDPAYFPGDDLFTPTERAHGIPIGNLTSQFFANLYLDDFDHWIRGSLGIRGYVRYVDDLFLFADGIPPLRTAIAACAERLAALRLWLHPGMAHVRHTSEKVPVLGYQLSRERRWLRSDNGYRFRRRLRRAAVRFARGRLRLEELRAPVAAWVAHARHGEADALCDRILAEVVFRRGTEAGATTG